MKISPSNTAILVIDMQKDYCSKEGRLFSSLSNIQDLGKIYVEKIPQKIKEINRFIERSREEGVKIIWIKSINDFMEYNFPYLPQKEDNLLCTKNSPGEEFYLAEISEKDLIIEKNKQSAFSNHILERSLKEENIRNIILTGFFTSRCIRSTAQEAFEKNFGVIVAKDLVVDFPSNIQNKPEHSLEDLRDCWAIVYDSKDLFG